MVHQNPIQGCYKAKLFFSFKRQEIDLKKVFKQLWFFVLLHNESFLSIASMQTNHHPAPQGFNSFTFNCAFISNKLVV
jgi:hypothetical protein